MLRVAHRLPNILTFLRIGLAPVICWMIMEKAHTMAFCFFTVAGLTDFLDGYFAYKTDSRTALGAILDPLADKILMTMVFFFLAAEGCMPKLFLWLSALMILREMLILGLRTMTSAHRLPVIALAKWKTALQFISGGLLLWPIRWDWLIYLIACTMLGATFLSIMSAFRYMIQSLSGE